MTQQWKPIESVPDNDGRPMFCLLAFGPEGDQSVGKGFRVNGKWYVGATFYCPGQEKSYEIREIEVRPTNWRPIPHLPGEEPATPPASAQDNAKDDPIALDKLADYIADNWPDKKYGLEEICQRLNATWPGAFMPADPAAGDARELEYLQRLLEYAQTSDDCQYGTLSTALVRDLTEKAIAALSAAPTAGDAQIDRDAAFEAVRKRLCAIPRYSFCLDDDGVVRRVEGRSGNWIEFDAAHELFDPVCVDAALSASQQGGE